MYNAAAKVRVSMNDEEIHNQIKNQNLHLVTENKRIHGSQNMQFIQSSNINATRISKHQGNKVPPGISIDGEPNLTREVPAERVAPRRLPSKSVYIQNNMKPPHVGDQQTLFLPAGLEPSSDLRVNLQMNPFDRKMAKFSSVKLLSGELGTLDQHQPVGVSVFEAIQSTKDDKQHEKHDSVTEGLQSQRLGEMGQAGEVDGQSRNSRQLHISEERMDKLIDEVYANNAGGFFGFFSTTNQSRKASSKESPATPESATESRGHSD